MMPGHGGDATTQPPRGNNGELLGLREPGTEVCPEPSTPDDRMPRAVARTPNPGWVAQPKPEDTAALIRKARKTSARGGLGLLPLLAVPRAQEPGDDPPRLGNVPTALLLGRLEHLSSRSRSLRSKPMTPSPQSGHPS